MKCFQLLFLIRRKKEEEKNKEATNTVTQLNKQNKAITTTLYDVLLIINNRLIEELVEMAKPTLFPYLATLISLNQVPGRTRLQPEFNK